MLINARVCGGMPPGKVGKAGTQRLNLGAFQDLIIAVSHFKVYLTIRCGNVTESNHMRGCPILQHRLTLHATHYSDIILISKQLAIILLKLS